MTSGETRQACEPADRASYAPLAETSQVVQAIGATAMWAFTVRAGPYLVTIIVSALGWLLTNAANDLQLSAVLSYRMVSSDNSQVAIVTNLSKLKPIDRAHISLRCQSPSSPCFTLDRGNHGTAVPQSISPTGSSASDVDISDAFEATFYVTLPPGGQIALVTHPLKTSKLSIFNIPDTTSSKSVYLLREDLFTFFLAHYYEAIFLAFITFFVILILWTIGILGKDLTSANPTGSPRLSSSNNRSAIPSGKE